MKGFGFIDHHTMPRKKSWTGPGRMRQSHRLGGSLMDFWHNKFSLGIVPDSRRSAPRNKTDFLMDFTMNSNLGSRHCPAGLM